MSNSLAKSQGRPRKLPTDQAVHEIKSRFRSGTPWCDIAQETGISLRTIMRWKATDPKFWEDCTVHDRRAPYTKRNAAYWMKRKSDHIYRNL